MTMNPLNAATMNTAALLTARSVAPPLQKMHAMTPQQAEAAAHDFESMFIAQMLEQMFGDSIGTDAFGDADSGEIYKGLMMDAYGKEIERSGGMGIADYVKRELLKLQEI